MPSTSLTARCGYHQRPVFPSRLLQHWVPSQCGSINRLQPASSRRWGKHDLGSRVKGSQMSADGYYKWNSGPNCTQRQWIWLFRGTKIKAILYFYWRGKSILSGYHSWISQYFLFWHPIYLFSLFFRRYLRSGTKANQRMGNQKTFVKLPNWSSRFRYNMAWGIWRTSTPPPPYWCASGVSCVKWSLFEQNYWRHYPCTTRYARSGSDACNNCMGRLMW